MTQLLLPPAPPIDELAQYASEIAYVGFRLPDLARIIDPLYFCVERCRRKLREFQPSNIGQLEINLLAWAIEQIETRLREIVFGEKLPPLRVIERISNALAPWIEAIGQMCDLFASIKDYPQIAPRRLDLIESMTRYALAGHPFGKSHKGRKRWERRQTQNASKSTSSYQ